MDHKRPSLKSKIIRALLPPAETKFFDSLAATGTKNHHRLVKEFVDSFNADSIVIDLGGGTRKLADYVVVFDYTPFNQVQIVGDVAYLPFDSESIDGILIQEVLEHVPDPFKVVQEINRVLKPKGRLYVETPFIYPQHGQGYPDYYRFTLSGLEYLCKDFKKLESGVCMGPASTLSLILRRYFRERTKNIYLRYFITLVVGWATFWLKYVDDVLPRGPYLYKIASALYYVGSKRS